MKKFNLLTGIMSIAALLTGAASFAQGTVCNQFDYFYSDINYPNNQKQSDIYGVSIEDGEAILSPIVLDLEFGAHIAYSENNNLLYLVNDVNGGIRTLDPITDELGPEILPESGLSGVTTAGINADNKLVIGNSNGDLFIANLESNPYGLTDFDSGADVQGGDLTFTSELPLLASKPNGNLYTIIGGGAMNVMLGNVDDAVTGMATYEDGTSVIVSANGNSAFNIYAVDFEDGVESTESFNAVLDGELFTLNNGDMASGCSSFEESEEGCEDFRYFLADSPQGAGTSDIFGVQINGNNAELELLASVGYQAHLAFDEESGELYVINRNNGAFETYDLSAGTISGPTSLSTSLPNVSSAVVSPDGDLIVGNESSNEIYVVDIPTGNTSLLPGASLTNMFGGDLLYGSDGTLYYASRPGGGQLIDVMTNTLVGNLPSNVTGAALTNDGNIITSSRDFNDLRVYGALGSANAMAVYQTTLAGEPYEVAPSDLASGCAEGGIPGISFGCNYQLYYVHAPQGGGKSLLSAELNDDGTASVAEILTDFNGAHIGLSPDGTLLYLVGGSTVETYDVATGAITNTANVVTAGGNNLNGFPAAVVRADGTLLAGNSSQNQVYSIDPVTGLATPFGSSVSIQGGDLIEVAGEIWIITRGNNTFTKLSDGSSFTVPVNEINGAAVLENGNVLVADGNGDGLFKEIELSSQSVVAEYETGLDLYNGDMAGGCVGPDDDEIDACYPSEVLVFNQGLQMNGNPVSADRSDATKALGQPDASNDANGFVSLGVAGSITLGFPGIANDGPGDDIFIFETSFSGDECGESDDETAHIELSQNGATWIDMGSICRDGSVDIANSGLDYVIAIRITNSDVTNTSDGYDVDGVVAIYGCGSIPEDLCADQGDCYATSANYVQGSAQGGGAIAANRTNSSNSLGNPERVDQLVFTTLGYGGSITFEFDGVIPNDAGDDIEVVETTFNNSGCESYPEYADVSVSVDGNNFFYIGTVCKSDPFVDISDADIEIPFNCVSYVRVANNDDLTSTPDAYDVDGIVALHNCEATEEDQNNDNEELIAQTGDAQLSAYPNPTSGPAVIEFSTTNTERVTLEVTDMNGRVVKELFSQEAQAGNTYRSDFNGLNLPNGIYVAKLITENSITIEKIMIAK